MSAPAPQPPIVALANPPAAPSSSAPTNAASSVASVSSTAAASVGPAAAVAASSSSSSSSSSFGAVGRSMFAASGFVERRDLEQYFWTTNTVARLRSALEYVGDCCCLTTPTLADHFHQAGRDEVLLDIDDRFAYLPKFIHWDLLKPVAVDAGPGGAPFQVVVFDPPFFYVAMDALLKAVLTVVKGDTATHLMIGFLRREEPTLLKTFGAFNLRRTNFRLEYATVKPNKWTNYALYSNVDLPGIRREK